MEKTLALVNDEKISVYYASKQTGVPYGTLRRRITNESNIVIGKASKKPVLSTVSGRGRTINNCTEILCRMWLPSR